MSKNCVFEPVRGPELAYVLGGCSQCGCNDTERLERERIARAAATKPQPTPAPKFELVNGVWQKTQSPSHTHPHPHEHPHQ